MKFILSLVVFSIIAISSTAYSCDDTEKIYKVCSDQQVPFQAIVEEAKSEDKLILIKFGADWCPWCQSLHKMFRQTQVLLELEESPLFAEVGVYMYDSGTKIESGMSILLNIFETNGKTKEIVTGFPFLAVVRASDSKAVFIETGDLEDNSNGKGHDPSKVKEALNKAIKELR